MQKAFQAIEEAGRALYAGLEISEKRDTFARTSVFDWVSPQLSALALPFFSSGFSAEWCAHPKEVSMLHYLEYQRGFDVEGEEMDFRFREGLFRAAEGLARELSNETKIGRAHV